MLIVLLINSAFVNIFYINNVLFDEDIYKLLTARFH